MKKHKNFFTWFFVTVLFFSLAYFLLSKTSSIKEISFTDFKVKWIQNEISEIKVFPQKMQITAIDKNKKLFNVFIPEDSLNNLLISNPKSNIDIEYFPSNNTSLFSNPTFLTICLLLLIGIIYLTNTKENSSESKGKNIISFSRSKAKLISPNSKKINFSDVAGADEEKSELEEIVDFLKEPAKYSNMGARIPKGILLVGPPGTGKTLLARAVAGEADAPFYTISGSDFVEMFVGVGASRVRDLFEQAKRSSPSLIFIDEIDAVGRRRGTGLGGGHDEREQTLNQLLVEMDGFGSNEGIIIIAATNRPDILDPALLRPGRFDRQIFIGRPDKTGREAVLKIHTSNKPLNSDVDLEVLAKRTTGFSGADIENLTNEAALSAVRKNKKDISMEDFEEAITKVIAGPEKKSRTTSEKDRKLTAYHEAGHAVVMKLLKNSDPIHEISIIPRGMAGGYTMHLPIEDSNYISKNRLLDDMVGLLGGRVAEKLILNDISTGAKNDIDRASAIARAMVMDYGMSDSIGTISYNIGQNEVFLGRDLGKNRNFSEQISYQIDNEVKRFITEAYLNAETLLNDNINKLHAVANALLEKEKLDGIEFEEIFNSI